MLARLDVGAFQSAFTLKRSEGTYADLEPRHREVLRVQTFSRPFAIRLLLKLGYGLKTAHYLFNVGAQAASFLNFLRCSALQEEAWAVLFFAYSFEGV